MKRLIMCILMIVNLVGCAYNNSNMNTGTETVFNPIRIAIFPNGTISETYIINVKSDGVLTVTFGNKKSQDMQKDDFSEYPVPVSKETKLQANEMLRLKQLIYEIQSKNIAGSKKDIVDGWEYIVFVNGKKYNYNYDKGEEKVLYNFVKELINLSPIEVNLHGWS